MMKINALFLILMFLTTSLGFSRETSTFYETSALKGRPRLIINNGYNMESDNESEKTDDSLALQTPSPAYNSQDNLHLLSLYNPIDALEKYVDHYIFDPLLYLAGSASITGGFLYYYNLVGSGTVVLEVGLGVMAGTLFLKSVFRIAAGISKVNRDCLRHPI